MKMSIIKSTIAVIATVSVLTGATVANAQYYPHQFPPRGAPGGFHPGPAFAPPMRPFPPPYVRPFPPPMLPPVYPTGPVYPSGPMYPTPAPAPQNNNNNSNNNGGFNFDPSQIIPDLGILCGLLC
jgi:hypothetical protein